MKSFNYFTKAIRNGFSALLLFVPFMVQAQSQPTTLASIAPTASSAISNTPAISAEDYGKIIGENDTKEYVSLDGKNIYKIGDKIRIGLGSGMNQQFQFITAKVSKHKVWKMLGSSVLASSLDRDYQGQVFTITDMYEGYAKQSDIFVKNAPKKVFLIFSISKSDNYDVAIETALQSKEVIPNN